MVDGEGCRSTFGVGIDRREVMQSAIFGGFATFLKSGEVPKLARSKP
jgi:hypothetical protein